MNDPAPFFMLDHLAPKTLGEISPKRALGTMIKFDFCTVWVDNNLPRMSFLRFFLSLTDNWNLHGQKIH